MRLLYLANIGNINSSELTNGDYDLSSNGFSVVLIFVIVQIVILLVLILLFCYLQNNPQLCPRFMRGKVRGGHRQSTSQGKSGGNSCPNNTNDKCVNKKNADEYYDKLCNATETIKKKNGTITSLESKISGLEDEICQLKHAQGGNGNASTGSGGISKEVLSTPEDPSPTQDPPHDAQSQVTLTMDEKEFIIRVFEGYHFANEGSRQDRERFRSHYRQPPKTDMRSQIYEELKNSNDYKPISRDFQWKTHLFCG